MCAIEQRMKEINRDTQRLLLDVIECRLSEVAILDAARFYRVARLRQSQNWRDKARPDEHVCVFDWATGHEGGSR